jgi:hypothetical protein
MVCGSERSARNERNAVSGVLENCIRAQSPLWAEYGELNSVRMLTAVVDDSARLLKLIATGTDHWGALEANSEKHRAMYFKMPFCFAVGVWKSVRPGWTAFVIELLRVRRRLSGVAKGPKQFLRGKITELNCAGASRRESERSLRHVRLEWVCV